MLPKALSAADVLLMNDSTCLTEIREIVFRNVETLSMNLECTDFENLYLLVFTNDELQTIADKEQ